MNDDNRFDVRMRQMVKNYQDHAPQNDVSINDNNIYYITCFTTNKKYYHLFLMIILKDIKIYFTIMFY